ncbi:hypothetical protein Tco_1525071 [Tanacetum coccineum]
MENEHELSYETLNRVIFRILEHDKDELIGLETSFDVLDSPYDAAAKNERQRSDVANFCTMECEIFVVEGSGYHQKDRKPSQNDKTEHGMEKTVQNQGQSPNAKVQSQNRRISSQTEAGTEEYYWMQS